MTPVKPGNGVNRLPIALSPPSDDRVNAWAEPSAGPVSTTGSLLLLLIGGTTTGGGVGAIGGETGEVGVPTDQPTSASAAKSSAEKPTRVPICRIGSSETGIPLIVTPSAQWALPFNGTAPPYTP